MGVRTPGGLFLEHWPLDVSTALEDGSYDLPGRTVNGMKQNSTFSPWKAVSIFENRFFVTAVADVTVVAAPAVAAAAAAVDTAKKPFL